MNKNGFKIHPEFHLHFLCSAKIQEEILYDDLKRTPNSVTLHAILLFQPTHWHFTCPIYNRPLPCSTGYWALYHTCPLPSATSQLGVPALWKQAAAVRGSSNPPPFGGFQMAQLEEAPADQCFLARFPGALWSRQQDHFPAFLSV